MKKPHKHAALIKEWADNPSIQIECRPPPEGRYQPEWRDLLSEENPLWFETLEYRKKPSPKLMFFRNYLNYTEYTKELPKIRVITMKGSSTAKERKEIEVEVENYSYFTKWLGDWQMCEY